MVVADYWPGDHASLLILLLVLVVEFFFLWNVALVARVVADERDPLYLADPPRIHKVLIRFICPTSPASVFCWLNDDGLDKAGLTHRRACVDPEGYTRLIVSGSQN